MNDGNHTGNAQKLPLAERARQGLLLSEPALPLVDVLALEHPFDRAARKALGAALRAAVNFGDLPVSREQRTARIRRKESTWLSGDWTLGNGDPPTRIWTETQSTVVEYVTREAYRTWRAQCPKRLLSDLSKIDKWLGAMPTPVESLPESLPESSKRGIALVEAENAALVALRKALKREPDFEEFWDYLTTKDETGTVADCTADRLDWIGKSEKACSTSKRTIRNRLTAAKKRNPFTPS